MKVSQLIELLQGMDPEGEVYLCTGSNWPFEYSVRGVVERSEMEGGVDEAPEERSDDTLPNDVLLVEGSQVRYGSKDAWDYCRR